MSTTSAFVYIKLTVSALHRKTQSSSSATEFFFLEPDTLGFSTAVGFGALYSSKCIALYTAYAGSFESICNSVVFDTTCIYFFEK